MADTIPLSSVLNFLKMTASLPSIPLFVGYVLTVAVSGLWQRWTSPYEPRVLLIVHNFCCCVASVATLGGFSYCIVKHGSLYGKTPDPFLAQVFKLYWITKVAELVDTVFMVLQHQQREISFFHAYQHASILLFSDMARLHYRWQSLATFLTINSLVHVFQYLYHGLASLDPQEPPQWKKGIAQLQLTQYIIILLFTINGYRYHNFCIFCIIYGASLLILFLNYYFHEFMKKAPTRYEVRKRF